jgi:hypothetical protein
VIRNIGYIVYGPFHDGSWRYRGGDVVVSCDQPGCAAVVTPSGLEHNGGAIESIYLPRKEDGGPLGWCLGERDLCPDHAPPDDPHA